MATKTYALSKTKVREMIESAFGKEGQVDVKDVIALFEGKGKGTTAGSTLVKDADGNVIGKRCSYFGVYMPIEEFGKRGENYAYQCKLAESIGRKKRTEIVNKKAELDEQLQNEEITVAEWKEALAELEKMKDEKVTITDIEDAPEYFETAEELIEALSGN